MRASGGRGLGVGRRIKGPLTCWARLYPIGAICFRPLTHGFVGSVEHNHTCTHEPDGYGFLPINTPMG